jgi:predicted nucleotidyltransferase
MDSMDELTVKEIADQLGFSFETVKSRIRALDEQPVRKVGKTNVYAPGIVERVRNAPPRGRRPKPKDDK